MTLPSYARNGVASFPVTTQRTSENAYVRSRCMAPYATVESRTKRRITARNASSSRPSPGLRGIPGAKDRGELNVHAPVAGPPTDPVHPVVKVKRTPNDNHGRAFHLARKRQPTRSRLDVEPPRFHHRYRACRSPREGPRGDRRAGPHLPPHPSTQAARAPRSPPRAMEGIAWRGQSDTQDNRPMRQERRRRVTSTRRSRYRPTGSAGPA